MSLVLGLTADLRDGRLPCAPAALLEANFPIPLGSFSSPRSSPGCSGMHPPFQASPCVFGLILFILDRTQVKTQSLTSLRQAKDPLAWTHLQLENAGGNRSMNRKIIN
jgi:hypothetical protein